MAGTRDADVWWELRALRAAPPRVAAHKARRTTFVAALEQCEQLIGAAAAISYEARPLPLFYALSQAGRAITAALEPDHALWKLSGHGIAAKRLDVQNLWDIQVTGDDGGRGSSRASQR